jgi:tetratricopeptide (TPR) repeat protein
MTFYDFILGKAEKSLEDLDRVVVWADKAGNRLRRATADLTRGVIYYELGELGRSEELVQRGFNILLDLFPDVKSLEADKESFLGLIDVKKGQIDSAKTRLKEIESILSLLSEKEALLASVETKVEHDVLKSEILIAEGSPEEAIKVFKSIAYPPIPGMRIDDIGPDNLPFIRDTLARAYLKNGDVDAAIAEYEKMIVFDPKGHDRLLIHPKYRYLLAKLYEEKGEVAKAIEQYEAFLELWKDADPDLPELVDAKKRLLSLLSN